MAATSKPKLLFNDKPISEAEATKLLKEIYGEKRVEEIFSEIGRASCRERVSSPV